MTSAMKIERKGSVAWIILDAKEAECDDQRLIVSILASIFSAR